jgi:hypothetical protein
MLIVTQVEVYQKMAVKNLVLRVLSGLSWLIMLPN